MKYLVAGLVVFAVAGFVAAHRATVNPILKFDPSMFNLPITTTSGSMLADDINTTNWTGFEIGLRSDGVIVWREVN